MIKIKNIKLFKNKVSKRLLQDTYNLLEQEDVKDEKIRIMPDAHPGSDVMVGFTSTLEKGLIDPKKIGFDIGCGVTVYKIGKFNPDVVDLHTFISNEIPAGRNIHESQKVPKEAIRIINMVCKNTSFDIKQRAIDSLGTLGGGNHFISLAKDEDEVVYLVIHSGSRGFGGFVAKYFMDLVGQNAQKENVKARQELIKQLKSEGKQQEIQEKLAKLPQKSLKYLEGMDTTTYFRVLQAVVEYASINRNMMANKILKYLGVDPNSVEITESIHNYISDDGIMRKGAIKAYEGQKVVIPINLVDGIILGVGKGNEDWNYSAPHGAGRDMSRSEAKATLNEEEQLKLIDEAGIYAPNQPLDEMMGAYRGIDEILPQLEPTVEVKRIIKPFFNFQT